MTKSKHKSFNESGVAADPVMQFLAWFAEAAKAVKEEVNAMCLSTAGKGGRPSGRMVLLKEVDYRGFVFYTSYASRKGEEIGENPRVAATFFWKELERQVRITGKAKKITARESRAYFDTRPLESRVSAAISPQSKPIPNRRWLEKKRDALLKTLNGRDDVPMPSDWGGYRIVPDEIEFWQGREFRLHDRILYQKKGKSWKISRLAP